MRLRIITFLLLTGMNTASAQFKSENLFYMVNTPESFESFKTNIRQISVVCPQTFLVSKEGVLSGSVDHRIIELARANNVKVMPLIVNGGFNQKLLHDIVSNPASRKRSIAMMLEYARKYGLSGWQFDLEGLHISDMADFTLYYKETADALHQAGLKLSLAVVHATENVGGPTAYHLYLYENWRAGYALKELADIGDFISVMTYDQHTRRTTPGPVASPEWMERVVKYLLDQKVPAEKISLGIPNYSVHFFTDYTEEKGGFASGRSVKYPVVQHLLGQFEAKPLWHEKAQVNYAMWDNDGVFEYLFIEDNRSLKPKLEVLKKYKLRGISVWVLGGEDPAFWTVLKQQVQRSE
jgi:spore germination protein YaaH